ncbi:hypothetical protein BLNAU_9116 [Blattamonas nauphoetae]|uniref:Uncharacterized protein n=1 Tax=Blattamonas nauphoetae TaxID=2049346 RepID=A0ABQ9XWV5_9EUKA|nr:hypothetical protein BLNAU_9116 [Blattamonas nauphoetae]
MCWLKAACWERKHCKCGHNFWTNDTERAINGDNNCEESYMFVQEPCQEIKSYEHKLTCQEAFTCFEHYRSHILLLHTLLSIDILLLQGGVMMWTMLPQEFTASNHTVSR